MYKKIDELARLAGKMMLDAVDVVSCTDEKTSNADIVTEYDVKIQKFLFQRLAEIFPDAEFVGEEGEGAESISEKLRGRAFIIDPIDGTTNFVRGLMKSAVSIALIEKGECVYGCAYDPYSDELYTAKRGEGAFLNGKRINCSRNPIEHAVCAFGTVPYYKNDLGDASFDVMKTLYFNAMDVRRMGSAVLDLCSVAAGRCDLYCELRLSPWDFAAASLIATEAGAIVRKMNGEGLVYDKKISVVAANPECMEFFMKSKEIQRYADLF